MSWSPCRHGMRSIYFETLAGINQLAATYRGHKVMGVLRYTKIAPQSRLTLEAYSARGNQGAHSFL